MHKDKPHSPVRCSSANGRSLRYRWKARARQGAVTVEFALVLPIFLLLVFASIEFAQLNTMQHIVNNAAYEAARLGIVPGASATDMENAATAYLQNTVNAKGFTVTVTPDPIVIDTTEVTVRIVVPMDQNSWIVPRFSSGLSMGSSSTLRTERYRGIVAPPPPDDD